MKTRLLYGGILFAGVLAFGASPATLTLAADNEPKSSESPQSPAADAGTVIDPFAPPAVGGEPKKKEEKPEPDKPILDPEGQPYFPEDSVARGEDHLHAMGEPSLYARREDKSVEEYRFTYLPTFSRPIAFRAFRDGEKCFIRVVRLDGPAGYRSGEVEVEGKIKVDPQLYAILVRRMSEDAVRDPWGAGPELLKHYLGALDGERWILEGVKDGEYFVAEVQNPETIENQTEEMKDRVLKEFYEQTGVPKAEGDGKAEYPNLDPFIGASRMFLFLSDFSLPQEAGWQEEDEEGKEN